MRIEGERRLELEREMAKLTKDGEYEEAFKLAKELAPRPPDIWEAFLPVGYSGLSTMQLFLYPIKRDLTALLKKIGFKK